MNGQRFYDENCKHLGDDSVVVDFGSLDVNGTLKPIFAKHKYVGIDMEAGPNVDIISSTHEVALPDAYADVIVSTSCFEHDPMFWLSFLEMCRLLKPGGLIYINAPSNGPYHAYPLDCWRFYLDSWKALLMWAGKNGYTLELVNHYIDKKNAHTDPVSKWEDSVGIFKKSGV